MAATRGDGVDDGPDRENVLDKMKDIITNSLSLVVYDVESTVSSAAFKALRDESGEASSTEYRIERARSLRLLGITMQETAVETRNARGGVQPDIVKDMQDAFVKAIKKRNR